MPYKDVEQKRAYQRKWMKARRAAWFKGKVCAVCSSDGPLELDHMDPALKVSHKIWSWAKVRRLAELKKCQPLCTPCHQDKTRYDNNYGLRHGTPNGYSRYKCRCPLCKAAHNEAVNQWRWKSRRHRLEEVGIQI